MAFTFTVEDGTGVAGANSYTTVDFADTYISINSQQQPTWDALSTQAKEHLLARATQYLDRMIQWKGEKTIEDSALRWPRAGVYDTDGILIADDVIPRVLQEATAEVAVYFVTQDLTRSAGGGGELEELHVDVIELHWRDSPPDEQVPSWILALIDCLGWLKEKPGRGTRFKTIKRR